MTWWICAYLIGGMISIVMIHTLFYLGFNLDGLKKFDAYVGAFILSWVSVIMIGIILILTSFAKAPEKPKGENG